MDRHNPNRTEVVVNQQDVEFTAYLLWEKAGKPPGAEKWFWQEAYNKVKDAAWAAVYDTRPRPPAVPPKRTITLSDEGTSHESGTV